MSEQAARRDFDHGAVMGRGKIIPMLASMVGAGCIYATWPRSADLRAFDPAAMAHLETAMWRDYYDAALFYHLYEVSRLQFGFAPIDSFRVALAAAEAAKTFQPTRSREAANAAMPPLVTYYRLLGPAAPAALDVEEAARLELDWWQARREVVGPRDYGVTVAKVTALAYGKRPDDPGLIQSGIARAEAMAYRDARGQGMAEQDWAEIESRLLRAYRSLKTALADR
jgi:hypothetical protein